MRKANKRDLNKMLTLLNQLDQVVDSVEGKQRAGLTASLINARTHINKWMASLDNRKVM